MSVGKPKQIVYRYDGDAASEEPVTDFDGEVRVPQKDEIVRRKGKDWKVVAVNEQTSSDGRIPVHRVFLQGIQ